MEREKPVNANASEAATPVRQSTRKRPRIEWVSEEHTEMRKRLRTMSLDEMATHMLNLQHQVAAAAAVASAAKTNVLYDEEEDETVAGMETGMPPAPPLPALASLFELPDEMMASVVARLGPSDVTSVSDTCRLLRKLVTEHRYVLEFIGTHITDEIVQWLNRFVRLGVLVLNRATFPAQANPLGQLTLPALREIYMTNMMLADHGAFLSRLNGLQKVHFDHVNNISAAHNFQTVVPSSLETLVVLHTPLRAVLCPGTPALKHLIYESTDVRADRFCMNIARQFRASLQILECGMPKHDAFLAEDPLNLSQLQTLKLRDTQFPYTSAAYFFSVPFVFGALPALRKLELDTIEGVQETLFLRSVPPFTPALREIVLSGSSITCAPIDAGIDDYAWNTAFPHLERLNIMAPPIGTESKELGACLNRIARVASLRHLSITNVADKVDSAMLWGMCRLNTMRLETLVLGDIGPLSTSDILMLYTLVPTLKRISVF